MCNSSEGIIRACENDLCVVVDGNASSSKADKGDNDKLVYIIVAVVLGVIVIIGIIGLAVYCTRNKRKKPEPQELDNTGDYSNKSGPYDKSLLTKENQADNE